MGLPAVDVHLNDAERRLVPLDRHGQGLEQALGRELVHDDPLAGHHVLTASGPVTHDGEFPDFASQLTAIGEYLLTLPGSTRVLPGQGAETTIAAAEKHFDAWVSAGPV